MTNKRAAELLSDVTVLDDPEMYEAHDLAISALKQQDFICRITNLPCSACKPGPCDSRKELVTDRHQMTNADRIRAMSDEEMAEWVCNNGPVKTPCDIICGYGCKAVRTFKKSSEEMCKEIVMKWLQQPDEEVKHGQ